MGRTFVKKERNVKQIKREIHLIFISETQYIDSNRTFYLRIRNNILDTFIIYVRDVYIHDINNKRIENIIEKRHSD